jgi:hypothetical protein
MADENSAPMGITAMGSEAKRDFWMASFTAALTGVLAGSSGFAESPEAIAQWSRKYADAALKEAEDRWQSL